MKEEDVFYCDINRCLECPLDECATSKRFGKLNGKRVKVIKRKSDTFKSADKDRYWSPVD